MLWLQPANREEISTVDIWCCFLGHHTNKRLFFAKQSHGCSLAIWNILLLFCLPIQPKCLREKEMFYEYDTTETANNIWAVHRHSCCFLSITHEQTDSFFLKSVGTVILNVSLFYLFFRFFENNEFFTSRSKFYFIYLICFRSFFFLYIHINKLFFCKKLFFFFGNFFSFW